MPALRRAWAIAFFKRAAPPLRPAAFVRPLEVCEGLDSAGIEKACSSALPFKSAFPTLLSRLPRRCNFMMLSDSSEESELSSLPMRADSRMVCTTLESLLREVTHVLEIFCSSDSSHEDGEMLRPREHSVKLGRRDGGLFRAES